MKKVVKICSALAILSLVALAPKTNEVQSAPASLEAMTSSVLSVAVIKDWGMCNDLMNCATNLRFPAEYAGTMLLGHYYDIYYYNGGSCGKIITSAFEIPPCN